MRMPDDIRLRPGIEQESSRLIKLPGELRNKIVRLALYEENGITYHCLTLTFNNHYKNNDSGFRLVWRAGHRVHSQDDANQLKYVCWTLYLETRGRVLSNDITFKRRAPEQPNAIDQFDTFTANCSDNSKARIRNVYLRPIRCDLGPGPRPPGPFHRVDDLPIPFFLQPSAMPFGNTIQFCQQFPQAMLYTKINSLTYGARSIDSHALIRVYWIIRYLRGVNIVWPYPDGSFAQY